jgi:membrane-bound ClpP family serine protease
MKHITKDHGYVKVNFNKKTINKIKKDRQRRIDKNKKRTKKLKNNFKKYLINSSFIHTINHILMIIGIFTLFHYLSKGIALENIIIGSVLLLLLSLPKICFKILIEKD